MKWIFHFLAVCAIILGACQPASVTPMPTPAKLTWFASAKCDVQPCWEGIVFGKTKRDESISLLNDVPYIWNINTLPCSEDKSKTCNVFWNWKNFRLYSGSLTLDIGEPSQVVLGATFWLTDPIPLKNIIDDIGQPSHVVVSVGLPNGNREQTFDMSLLFLQRGVYVQLNHSGVSSNVSAQPDTPITMIRMFTTKTDHLQRLLGVSPDALTRGLVNWQGYGSFVDYCLKNPNIETTNCS
jgi:hypothetical protein